MTQFVTIDPKARTVTVGHFETLRDAREQNYFSIFGRLIAGAAVLYGIDEAGATIDLTTCPEPVWFDRVSQIEFAIKCGAIRRPVMKVNDEVIWRWPDPRPKGMMP
jgi:hypothetical protein